VTRAILCLGILATAAAQDLPLKQGSVRFAVIGDMGTGDKPQYEIATQMEASREKTMFDFVLTLGDNIYGAKDMKKKFEDPYKPLLDAGIKFYASLGNHDNPNERFYKPFNMGEKRYYSFKKGNAEFFALDSNYMDPEQTAWLDKALHDSSAAWKICYFHHPLYSDGKFHGPDTDLRERLEPILQANGVRVVLTGHEHLYERIKPHGGIYYFVLGNSGELRTHNLKASPDTAKGFDTDRDFMLMEIAGDQLYFQTISRTGETIDSGEIDRK
jgi:predicted phosphodiesterase